MSNLHSLKIVSRGTKAQLQVVKINETGRISLIFGYCILVKGFYHVNTRIIVSRMDTNISFLLVAFEIK